MKGHLQHVKHKNLSHIVRAPLGRGVMTNTKQKTVGLIQRSLTARTLKEAVSRLRSKTKAIASEPMNAGQWNDRRDITLSVLR